MRGIQQDDEWEKIPEEWLQDGKKNAKTGLESDGEASELTELSDEEEDEEQQDEEDDQQEEPEKEDPEEEQPAAVKPDFIEWETVSLPSRTLYVFANCRH